MVTVDETLSKGLVRTETRALRNALRQHTGDVLRTFFEGVEPRFRQRSRLTLGEMQKLAADLGEQSSAAFSPLYSAIEVVGPTAGRPQSGSYEILQYWINPVEVEGTTNRLMKIAVFSAWGDRKQISLRAQDTLMSFYEHAAHRLLQRGGNQQTAVRAIGKRLVDTLILPTLALHERPASLADAEMHIPFENGLLVGTFVERPQGAIVGDYARITKQGRRGWRLSVPARADFVVKTYLGPEEMNDRRQWIAYEVDAWLASHSKEAEIIKRYICQNTNTLWKNGHMTEERFGELHGGFWRMHARVFENRV
ncbi:hypothetical protein [Rhizobium terrae]|uniref:hypothetical protein n=1 Tax=Rhizobium terrae TaxID=2171756 RepID=UPI0013C2D408|nr:hypothetical protein [Rhizobium terrae]